MLTVREQMLKDEQQRLAVASRIRELRGPTPQPVIAEKVGVGLRGYQKWESTGGISWDNLQKLAKVHGVDADWILKGDGQQATPDLMAATNGSDSTRLARIEHKIDRLLEFFATRSDEPDLEERLAAIEEIIREDVIPRLQDPAEPPTSEQSDESPPDTGDTDAQDHRRQQRGR